MNIKVNSGKYTFCTDGAMQIVDIWRGAGRAGSAWVTLHDGFNAIHAMMCELDAARVVVAAARSIALGNDAATLPRDMPPALARALELHDALVSDRTPPSDWAQTPLLSDEIGAES